MSAARDVLAIIGGCTVVALMVAAALVGLMARRGRQARLYRAALQEIGW